MTLRRLRQSGESRSGMLGSWPNGYGLNDPAAIPPPGMYSMQRAGVPVTPHTSLQVDVVHTALRVISNGFIKMGDPRGYKIGYDSENRQYREWLRPNPAILTSTFGQMFQYDGRRRTVVSMALYGEAFWYTLTRDYLGFPSALEVLNPLFVTVNLNKETKKTEYFYGSGQNKVQIPSEDITHIPFMAVPGGRRGLSSIEYAGVQYALALAAMEYGQRWFAQGASPSFILSTEQKLGKDQVERIAQKFLIDHSGLQSSHLPLVVDSGLKVDKVSSTPDEAQYLQTLEYSRMCLASWFGLPSHLVGGAADKGNVWGKTVEEQGFQMVDYTFSGYTVPIEEALSSLLPRGQYAAFDESKIMRANAADKAAWLTAVRSTAVETQNEYRVESLKKKPLPGGDTLGAPLNSNVSPGATAAGAQAEDNAGNTGGI